VCVSINAAVDKIAAVDRLVPGEIHRPDVLSVVPGGKAINVARAASCLGLAASVVPVVAGHAGAWLEEALAARGLATRPVRIPGESRTCLSVLDRSTGQLTELYEPGPELDGAGWAAVEAAVAAELASEPETAVVVVAGSLPPGAPPDAYARIVGVARAAGARCAVDVGGPPLAMAVAAGPWLVKVNAREAAEATGLPQGGEAEAVAAARALRAAGATIACVTRGLDGAVIVDEAGAAWRIGAPPELGPYPVGSGDSMLAGFAAGVAAGHPAAEAARRGSVAAAANALRPGQGELDPGDLARLEPLATVDRLDG
jgi:tagatose 6-phosphate kinase